MIKKIRQLIDDFKTEWRLAEAEEAKSDLYIMAVVITEYQVFRKEYFRLKRREQLGMMTPEEAFQEGRRLGQFMSLDGIPIDQQMKWFYKASREWQRLAEAFKSLDKESIH